jgi:hypothetical protein
MKRIRVALTALLVGAFMFLSPSPAFAEQAFAEVTCAKGDGTEQTFSIGWDNSNQFFDGRGEIPRLYCEGGYAQPYNFYVRDNLPADSPLRWFNGIAPILEPTPEPVPSIEPSLNPEPTPTPEPTPEPTESTEPTATPEPTTVVEATPIPETTPTPTPTQSQAPPSQPPLLEVETTAKPEQSNDSSQLPPEPTLEPTPEPTPTPSESVQEVVQVEPVAPDLVPTPTVVVIDQTVALEVPALLDGVIGITAIFEAAEAFMNIGSDMTPEERDESQSVVVAAVIVGQLAMRKIK